MPALKPAILLVHHDQDFIERFARALKRQCRLHTVSSAEEAIAILAVEEMDAVVADDQACRLPGGALFDWVAASGMDLVRILLTSQAGAAAAAQSLVEGRLDHFFIHPCSEAQLASTVRQAAEGRTWRNQDCRSQLVVK